MKTPNPDAGLPTADDVRGIIPRSTPAQDATALAEALIEKVTDELLAHGEFSASGNNRPNAHIAAKAVIDIVRATSQTPDAVQFPCPECDNETSCLNRCSCALTPSASAGPQAEADDFKLVYVKRWRTLVKLPTKYADEIVEALRAHPQPQQADGRGAVIEGLPKSETMLTYASILEKPKYQVDEKTGIKYRLATGEVVEAACAALRYCAALQQSPATDGPAK